MSTAPGRATAAIGEPAWVGRTLVALLLGAQVLVVGGVCFALTSAALGAPTTEPAPAAVAVAVAAVAATIRPARRWIVEGVDDLLSDARSLAAPPFAAVERHTSAEPSQLLAALAATLGTALDALAVEIVVWPQPATSATGGRWAAGATGTFGVGVGAGPSSGPPSGRTSGPGSPVGSVELPLRNDGRAYGVLWIAPRARRRLDPASDQLLAGLAHHVGLVVSSAVLRDELAGSRERLVLAREEERRRLRRDLHDGLGPDLAAIKLQLSAARRQLEPFGIELAALDELRTMVGHATDEVRRVVEDLRPPLLDDCGLVDALRSLRFVPPTLRLVVEAPAVLPPLPAAVEVALYRIGAEAVRNTVRHAAATTCTVTVAVDVGRVVLSVRDDGGGLAPSHRAGVGTTVMRERAEELGGILTIGAAPGGGTLVTTEIPLRGVAAP